MESVRAAVESLNLTLIYGGFVLAGLLFCGLVFVFGGDHGDGGSDVGGDHGAGCMLSPTGVAIFTTSFGAFGLIFHNGMGVTPLRSIVYAGGGGAVMMLSLTWMFYQLFVKSGATVRNESADGTLAEVYTAIPEQGVGEVVYRNSRGRQKSVARSRDGRPISRGTSVRIESSAGATLVVTPIDSPQS